MKTWLYRIITTVAIVEFSYLILVNLALNLSITQTLINQHKPEKYAVQWEKAWTWIPFRIHARGISANGQTSSQQWQAETPAASASISILPLLQKSVRIHSVVAEDIDYYQRPRPKPHKSYASTRDFFPPIRGREIDKTPVTPAPKKKGNGWKIIVDDIHAGGNHRLWVYQFKGELRGTLKANVNFETRGGPFSLDNGQMDVVIDSLAINDNQQISSQGFLKGTLEFSPFVPSENKGIKSLGFMSVDAELNTKVENLEFLNFYLRSLQGMNLDGAGKLSGTVRYDQGTLLSPTSLAVVADELQLKLRSYAAGGRGNVTIEVNDGAPEKLDLGIRFATIDVVHEEDNTSHFIGEDLLLTTAGSSRLLPWQERRSGARSASATIPTVTIPDLKVYQRYIPDKTALTLNGGRGELAGQTTLTSTSLQAGLNLRSSGADIGFRNHQLMTNLDLDVNIDMPSFGSGKLDISGTKIQLSDAQLASQEPGKPKPWNASLSIDKGLLVLPHTRSGGDAGPIRQLSYLKEQSLKSLLGKADANFSISGKLSELAWISLLFSNPYGMTIDGTGELTADIKIDDGFPVRESIVRILPTHLDVGVLDYEINGDGSITMQVLQGGEHPDLDLQVEIGNALFKRQGEQEAYVRDVAIKLQAQALKMDADQTGSNVDVLHLQIPGAKITDMSVYNDYLPANSPLRLLEGQAELKADIKLERDTAGGFVRLTTQKLRSRLDEQELYGELEADITIQGGVPENMDFDISGSTITLDKVRVTGRENNYEGEDWRAHFVLEKGRAIWKKPVFVHADAAVEIKDSRPFVAMFSNHKGEHKWIEKMLTIENIQGNAEMTVENEQITIPYAFTSSDKIDAGAKGIINAEKAEGIFYARFRKLDAVLQIRDGKRNIDIIGARKKFDEYLTGKKQE
jgi:hypothetical protein